MTKNSEHNYEGYIQDQHRNSKSFRRAGKFKQMFCFICSLICEFPLILRKYNEQSQVGNFFPTSILFPKYFPCYFSEYFEICIGKWVPRISFLTNNSHDLIFHLTQGKCTLRGFGMRVHINDFNFWLSGNTRGFTKDILVELNRIARPKANWI